MSTRLLQIRPEATLAAKADFTSVKSGLFQCQGVCGNHTIDGECGECHYKRKILQRKVSWRADVSEVSAVVHEILDSSGQPLDTNTRTFMESRFGDDFSQEWVHTDAEVAESARVNARTRPGFRNVRNPTGLVGPGTVITGVR